LGVVVVVVVDLRVVLRVEEVAIIVWIELVSTNEWF